MQWFYDMNIGKKLVTGFAARSADRSRDRSTLALPPHSDLRLPCCHPRLPSVVAERRAGETLRCFG